MKFFGIVRLAVILASSLSLSYAENGRVDVFHRLDKEQTGASSHTINKDNPSLRALRIHEPVVIDGMLDEEAWNLADSLNTFYQFRPHYNAPVSFSTTLKVAYDDTYIYFAFDCRDPQPEKITARATKRDGSIFDDDAVAIALDTFDDNHSAYLFAVNPLGTQLDGRFADNGGTADWNWDETWSAGVQNNKKGWICEIAIPLKSLKFNDKLPQWGLGAGRWIGRFQEASFINHDLVATTRVSQFGALTDLNLKNLAVKKYMFIPYVQGEFEQDKTPIRNAGLDARFNPVSNVGLSLTLNPDFATIEGDVEQLNLTRFELSYPEKRPFFLEGAEYYSTRIQQFYSRRIGEIPWGAKVNGKLGKWNLNGMVTASDPASAGADVESGNEAVYTVFRMDAALARGSTIGLIGANRTYQDANSGSVGLAGTLFFSDILGMTTQLIKSHGPETEGTWTGFIRPAYDSQFSHFHLRYSSYGTGVKKNMNTTGFIPHDDRKEFDTNLSHIFWINRYGFDSVNPVVNYNRYWSQTGVLRSWELNMDTEISYKKTFDLELSYQTDFKAEYDPYFEKNFHNHEWGCDFGYDNNRGFAASIEYRRGRIYDAEMEAIEGGLDIKPTDSWDISYFAEKTWLSPAEPEENTWIHYIRSSYYLNPDLYFKVFYQTRYEVVSFWQNPGFNELRKTLQLLMVWRFLPPFGSLQLSYQEGTTRFTDEGGRGQTFFTKLSWIF